VEPAGARSRQAVQLEPRRGPAQALLVSLRPRQWLKNLFVFAGIVFAAKIGDAGRWAEAVAAFAAFCAASSAAYLVNDVRDAPHDRLHALKRMRPIARGELEPPVALAAAGALAVAALAVAAALGLETLGFLAGFLVLQGLYSLQLKHVVLVDVLVIAALFVLRAGAGAAAVDVAISDWLLLCTALLALFLGFAKRRGELVLVGAERAVSRPVLGVTPGRPVLEGYSLELVDQLLSVVAAATVIAYGLYAIENEAAAMPATIPFVLFGVFRYLLLVHNHDLGEEPERVLLADRQLIAAVATWAFTAALILVLA
jgi:4-hydroxybenzoate polyprenyltransferase